MIFVSEIQDVERQTFFIYSIIQYFYRKAYLRAYKQYKKHERIIFVIEESQNVFDSTTVSKKLFNRLKIFSVARNLDLHFILASQRLQDLNTKIRGRTRLMLGNVSIDDYELKIRRLLRHSMYRKEILKFERGLFLYVAKGNTIKFPRFVQNGKPYEFFPIIEKPQPKPQKKGIFQRLKDVLNKPIYNPELEFQLEQEENELDVDFLEDW